MKSVCASMAVLLLSGGLALAQGAGGGAGGGTGGSTGGSSAGGGAGGAGGAGLSTRPGTASPTNPNGASVPSNNGTIGQAPGANPRNSQDLSNQNNPQDMTKPGASNPQDMKR
jgi:hypothetical protein